LSDLQISDKTDVLKEKVDDKVEDKQDKPLTQKVIDTAMTVGTKAYETAKDLGIKAKDTVEGLLPGHKTETNVDNIQADNGLTGEVEQGKPLTQKVIDTAKIVGAKAYETAKDIGIKAKDLGIQAKDTVGSLLPGNKTEAKEIGDNIRDKAEDEGLMNEKPLSEKVRDKAEDTGLVKEKPLTEKVTNAVKDVGNAVYDKVGGLFSSGKGYEAREKADEIGDSIRDKAEEKGIVKEKPLTEKISDKTDDLSDDIRNKAEEMGLVREKPLTDKARDKAEDMGLISEKPLTEKARDKAEDVGLVREKPLTEKAQDKAEDMGLIKEH